jgi:hypothetical protein
LDVGFNEWFIVAQLPLADFASAIWVRRVGNRFFLMFRVAEADRQFLLRAFIRQIIPYQMGD